MARDEAEQLLLEEDGVDGRYLVRESARTKSQMTLSLRFNGLTKNFRLYHDHGSHYVNELKRFDTLHDLVADGLITLYLELHAADYIANLTNQCRYEESPYMTLHRGRLPTEISARQHASQQSKLNPILTSAKQSVSPQSSVQRPGVPVSAPAASKPNRRSMFGIGSGPDGSGGIRPITSHEELEAPDDIYIQPCNSVPGPGTTNFGTAGSGAINIQAYEKAHNFKTHTFIGNPWCDFCGNFIWGLIGQGVRCDGKSGLKNSQNKIQAQNHFIFFRLRLWCTSQMLRAGAK